MAWPQSVAFAIEPHPALASGGYQLFDASGTLLGAFEDFELYADADPTGSYSLPASTADELPVVGVVTDRLTGSADACWLGKLRVGGQVESVGPGITVKHGYQQADSIEDFLEHYPPIVYFASGHVAQGNELFDVRGGQQPRIDPSTVEEHDWVGAGVDITAETKATAAKKGRGLSIHEAVESILARQPRQERFRWLICNDGAGEIADHILIEYSPGGPVRMDLWHSKYADGQPSLRVSDFQVVIAQAIRSRSRYNDPALWGTLRERLMHRQGPSADLVPGSDDPKRLLVLLGEQSRGGRRRKRSWAAQPPLTQGSICIVQPGLSRAALFNPAAGQASTADSLRQLFSAFEATMAATGRRARIIGSA